MKTHVSLASLTVALGMGLSAGTWADCTGPERQAGAVIYAASHNTMVFCDGTNWISMSGGTNVTVGGNTNTPGGSDTYVQFNSGGTAFGGSSAFTWNDATSTLTATNIAGTLATPAQPNITSLGTLTGLTMGGDLVATGYTVSATNVYALNVSGTTGAFVSLTVGGIAVTGGGGQGDRISTSNVTSGTTLAMAVADKGTISFTLAGTEGAAYIHPTVGFVGPGVSVTGQVSSNGVFASNYVSTSLVSTTNISVTMGQFRPTVVTNIAGNGGNYIVSQSTSVSVSNVGNGTIKFGTGSGLAMTISGSNVGIGTTAPAIFLDVKGSNQSYLGQVRIQSNDYAHISFYDSANPTPSAANVKANIWYDVAQSKMTIRNSNGGTGGALLLNDIGGNVGIGTTSPGAPLSFGSAPKEMLRFYDPGVATGSIGFGIASNDFQSFVGSSTNNFTWRQGGYGGAARITLLGTGNVRLHAYGAGTLVTDAGGNITASSDERLKEVQGSYTRGLEAINQINPITYKWNAKSGNEMKGIYAGMSAQNVQKAIPEAVGKDSRGYLTLSDRPIEAALINAVKELKADNDNLRAELRTHNADHAAIESLRRKVEALEAARR